MYTQVIYMALYTPPICSQDRYAISHENSNNDNDTYYSYFELFAVVIIWILVKGTLLISYVAGFYVTFQPFLSHQVEGVCCRARLFHSTQLTKLFIFRFKFVCQILLCEQIIGVCHGYFSEQEMHCFLNSRCFPESDVKHYIEYIKHNEISKHDLCL